MPQTTARLRRSILACLVLTALRSPAAENWKTPYAGNDATGAHVVGYWRFEPGAVEADSGPLKLTGKLRGATASPNGKFGGGLESFAGWPSSDEPHGMLVDPHPQLAFSGPFTMELWLQAKPDLAQASLAYLVDKKYASHTGYQWLLSVPDPKGLRRITVNLGFGEDSESFASEPIEFAPGVWHHLAASYDGAGTVRFFHNGSMLAAITRPGRQALASGPQPLSIADRLGSNYGGTPAMIDEVRLCRGALDFSPATVTIASDRLAWLRGEPVTPLRVTVRNQQREPLGDLQLTLTPPGGSAKTIAIPPLAAGSEHVEEVAWDSWLRPDEYHVRAVLAVPGDPPIRREESLAVKLVARPLPHHMPVVMWGIGSADGYFQEVTRLKRLGFTHCLGFGADYSSIWAAKSPQPASAPANVAATLRMLDAALADGMQIAASLHPGGFLKSLPDLRRVDRAGQPYKREDCNAALPGLAEFSGNVGISVAKTYGHHPAFTGALVNSEVRDDSEISFSPFDLDRFRLFSGRDIPAEVTTKSGVRWQDLPNFPADRVIPDDHPIREFYRWFWTIGDGWNELHTALHQGLKSTGREDLWTWYDPSIRVPSIGGSGGEVDVLSQWTYTEPSPLRVGYFADEVFAMATASGHDPRVMKMTQLFWYRSSSAPKTTGPQPIANPFDDHDPDAAYISIAPMHLRGSFWSKIARPVSGLMYHGWSSLVPTDNTHAYKYTQPDLQTEFQRLHREILEPLGPTLLQIPEAPRDVAYLNSFTSQMFARRGSYGYSHDEAYLTLLHAQLQPEVIFEETLLKQGLDRFKVVVLADCDVLPASIVAKVREFQRRGGVVIGDPNLAPAIKADIVIPKFTRTKKTAEDKKMILAHAAELRTKLDARYARRIDCSQPEIVTRLRGNGVSDYVFVVNDHREAGSYVGQHGLVMENGLPSRGEITLRRDGGHVYDLVANQPVGVESEGKTLRWPITVGPCDGRLFLVTPQPIANVRVELPRSAKRGETVDIAVAVLDPAGRPIPAVIPVQVEIRDAAGRVAEYTGHYGAANGTLHIPLRLATNDYPGAWEVRVAEGASGRTLTRYLRVE